MNTKQPSPDAQPTARSWWSRNWKWAVPVGCATPLLVCGGGVTLLLMFIFGTIKSSQPYEHSLAVASADARVIAALGTPIEPAWLVTGSIDLAGARGSAELSYDLTGPNGSATVHVVAVKSAGQWTYSTLAVDVHAGAQRIDLLSPAAAATMYRQ